MYQRLVSGIDALVERGAIAQENREQAIDTLMDALLGYSHEEVEITEHLELVGCHEET